MHGSCLLCEWLAQSQLSVTPVAVEIVAALAQRVVCEHPVDRSEPGAGLPLPRGPPGSLS